MTNNKLSCYEPLPNERQPSFQKFIIYRDLPPHERSLTKAAQQIASGRTDQNIKKIKSSLEYLSSKWQWVERCRLYDADRQLKLAKKKDGKFDELNDVLLDNIDGLIKYANDLLGEVIKNPKKDSGEPYSLVTRIKMSKDVSSLLKEAHELLCNLCGRPYEYKSMDFNGLLDVKAEVEAEQTSTVTIYDIVDEALDIE